MTPENRAGEVFFDLYRPLFESLLLSASADGQRWAHRVKTFESHGLLEFVTASNLKPKPVIDQYVEVDGERIYTFSEKQLEEPRWKRGFLRKIKAPRPGKWTRHHLQLHRDKVEDPKYREDIAKVLAYKWVELLQPTDIDIMYLKVMDERALAHFLDTFRRIDVTPENVNTYLMRRMAEELLDNNEKFQALMNRMKEEIAPVREQAYAEIRRICEEARERSQPVFDAIVAEAQRRADVALAEMQARSAAEAERSAKFWAEHSIKEDEDPEESFRRSVDKRIARQKAARKRLARMRRRKPAGFILWLGSRLAMVTVPIVLAYHVEFGESHTTLVDFIGQWFN